LKQKEETLKFKNEEEREYFLNQTRQEIQEIQEKYSKFFLQKENEKKVMEKNMKQQGEENVQKLEIISGEIDQEKKHIKRMFEMKRALLNEDNIKIKNQIQSFKKKKEKLKNQREVTLDLIKEKQKTLVPMQVRSKNLENTIKDQKFLLEEKNKKIADKERTINELKKEIQELEKFKYVLDFKIKDLNKDIYPKENELKELKSDISKEEHR
jgi:chromosome segregation ATPase